jgi:hypothetical protein
VLARDSGRANGTHVHGRTHLSKASIKKRAGAIIVISRKFLGRIKVMDLPTFFDSGEILAPDFTGPDLRMAKWPGKFAWIKDALHR